MDNPKNAKKYRTRGVRTLADGTIKEYYYNKKSTYKPVEVDSRSNNPGPKEKFTEDQKTQIMEKYRMGIKINRICADMNSSYTAVKRVIDSRKSTVISNDTNG
jgi:hypothetical protein